MFPCFIPDMGRPEIGQYQKSRERITDAVVRVDTSKLKTMTVDETPSSPSWTTLTQKRGWLLAAFLVGVVISVILTLYLVLKREHQIDNCRQEMHDLQRQIDDYEKRFLEMERRLVEQDTKIENMKD